MKGRRFPLPRLYYVGAVVGGLSCLTLAGLGTGWVQVGLMATSAMHWVLLIDLTRCGVWLRDDGVDVRVPLQGSFRRVGWRDIESVERRPWLRSRERVSLHLDDEGVLGLPRVRGQEELVAAIEGHVA